MRRWGSLIVLLPVMLVGCGQNQAEEDYLRNVQQFAEVAETNDADLIQYGKHYCEQLDTLGDEVTAMLSVQAEGAGIDELAPISASAGVHLCPELGG